MFTIGIWVVWHVLTCYNFTPPTDIMTVTFQQDTSYQRSIHCGQHLQFWDSCWMIYIYILVGGWAYPSEKYEFVSWDDDIPNIWKNKIHVPNHQSVYLHCKISKDIQYCTTNSCWSYPPFKLLLSSQTLEVSPIGQRTADLCSCWSTPGGLPKAIDGDLMWFNHEKWWLNHGWTNTSPGFFAARSWFITSQRLGFMTNIWNHVINQFESCNGGHVEGTAQCRYATELVIPNPEGSVFYQSSMKAKSWTWASEPAGPYFLVPIIYIYIYIYILHQYHTNFPQNHAK